MIRIATELEFKNPFDNSTARTYTFECDNLSEYKLTLKMCHDAEDHTSRVLRMYRPKEPLTFNGRPLGHVTDVHGDFDPKKGKYYVRVAVTPVEGTSVHDDELTTSEFIEKRGNEIIREIWQR